MKLEAKVVHYLSVMSKSELPFGGIISKDIENGFDGCDSKKDGWIILKNMERLGILQHIDNYSSDGSDQYCDVFQLSDEINI